MHEWTAGSGVVGQLFDLIFMLNSALLLAALIMYADDSDVGRLKLIVYDQVQMARGAQNKLSFFIGPLLAPAHNFVNSPHR
jgi:hypothetical protein